MSSEPSWLRAVLRVERTVGARLERAANTGEAADAMLLVARGMRLTFGAVERARATVIHALGLPTHRDVQLLDANVERLKRTIDEVPADDSEPGITP